MESEALQALENLRQRLLDVTTRNRLINFRHTRKGCLRVIDELPDQLVETLLDETEMRFEPVPEPNRKQLLDQEYIGTDETTGQEYRKKEHPTAEEWAKRCGLNTSYEAPYPRTATPNDRHTDTAIQTLLYPHELEARLRSLRQTSESAIQEMGANILYLAFGFLEWFETDGGDPRLAPLFLVPVRLQKGRLNRQTKAYEYRINYSGEDIIPNLSLKEKLRLDFGMTLPDMDEDTKPETYFKEILELIEMNQSEWKLRRYITLTLLNFSKLLMYLDLDPSRWPEGANITDHEIVKQFLGGQNTVQDENDVSNADLGFGEEYPVDEIEEIHQKYPLIDDADSSQHSALIDAIDGKNLVIEGPPGTGKSQTITNLIAAAMAQGKRVLFVAEKLAALDVVRRRLDAAGLGEFCLELHSHKSQKSKMLKDVKIRLDKRGNYRSPTEIEIEITRYEELKTALNNHAERINQPWKNTGKTLHEIFMAAVRYREVIGQNPASLHPEGYDGGNLDDATQRRVEDMLTTFCQVYQGITEQLDGDSDLQQHPWYGVRNINLQIFDRQSVQSAVENWQHSLQKLNDERAYLAEGLACGQDEVADSLKALSLLLEDLERLPTLKGNELLDRLPVLRGQSLHDAQRYLSLFEKIQTHYSTLRPRVGAEVLDDLSEVTNIIAGSEELILRVNPRSTLEEVTGAINQLEIMSGQLMDLQEPLEALWAVMGEDLSQRLSLTKDGLVELRRFIDLAASLAPSYWRFRAVLFDNDELDDLLPRLRDELEQLRMLQDELSGVFRLYALPDKDELRSIRETLDAGRGVFRWFDSRWRQARKRVLGLAAGTRAQFPKLYPLLEKAEEFSERRQALDENEYYQQAFGERLEGLETDMALLESLRNWYKSVRQEYGVDFGSRVALGSAILDMPRDTIRAVRSLSEQGITQEISNFLENLESVRTVFGPVRELNNNENLLAGDDGVISCLLRSSKEALLACEALLLIDNTIRVEELRDYKKNLVSFKQAVDDWQADDCDDRLFQGRLGLELGVNADNAVALSRLRNTLMVADIVALALDNENVRRRIYAQPEVATFNTIESLSSQLKSRIESQSTKLRDFVELTELESNDWMGRSGDQLDKLIARNDLALNNIESLQNWLDYVRYRKQLLDKGLVRLVRAVEYGDLDVSQMIDSYKAGIFDILAREILSEQPELSYFAGLTQNTYQGQFREYDNRLKDLQREKIAWQIDQRKIPNGNYSVRRSELTELHF